MALFFMTFDNIFQPNNFFNRNCLAAVIKGNK